MKKNILLFLSICMISVTTLAQDQISTSKDNNDINVINKMTNEAEITKVIFKLFDGMRLGDSSMVSSCFYSEVEMFTSFTDKAGNPHLKKGDLSKFLEAIGTPHEEIWDELIWDTDIKVDGNLAQVWTKYAFYVGENFSHCGVDAFLLTKTKEGWKIFHLADTRQREGCIEPRKK